MRGAGHWLGEGFALPPGAPAPDGFGGENNQRDPDEGERDQVRPGKGLVIEENAEEKAADRRQILEEAEGCEPKMTGGVSEPDKWQSGHDAGRDEEQRHRPAVGAES